MTMNRLAPSETVEEIASHHETQLAAIEQELARQDAELAISREQLGALGDCELGICDEVFSELDEAYAVKSPSGASTNLQLLRV